jgi:hypothetical protein
MSVAPPIIVMPLPILQPELPKLQLSPLVKIEVVVVEVPESSAI